MKLFYLTIFIFGTLLSFSARSEYEVFYQPRFKYNVALIANRHPFLAKAEIANNYCIIKGFLSAKNFTTEKVYGNGNNPGIKTVVNYLSKKAKLHYNLLDLRKIHIFHESIVNKKTWEMNVGFALMPHEKVVYDVIKSIKCEK